MKLFLFTTGLTSYTYDDENKLIYTNHSGSITKYAYDGMGNTISGGNSTTMTYDYERRLTSITLPSGDTVTYKYLPDGTRIMRANNIDTEYYLYDREDRIGDYDENGNLLISYTHGPATDEPVAMRVNGSTYFYIADIQGSIRAIVDTSGNLMASYVYDVWGNLVSHSGVLAERNDYLYTGREYDWETGIYYYRARSYKPELGRFLQQDPDGMVDGPNMYVYVGNDAVNKVDPSGTTWWTFWSDKISYYGIPYIYLKKGNDKWAHCFVSGYYVRYAGIPPYSMYFGGIAWEILESWVGGHYSSEDVTADYRGSFICSFHIWETVAKCCFRYYPSKPWQWWWVY